MGPLTRGRLARTSALAVAAALVGLLSACQHSRPDLTPRGLQPAATTEEQLAAALAPRRLAVLVGVDDYRNAAFPDLEFAGADALALADALRSNDGGHFDRIDVLTGPASTTRAAVLDQLRELRAGLQPQDTLVVYFSGHGTLALPSQGAGGAAAGGDGLVAAQLAKLFLLTSDSNPADLEGSALELSALRSFFGDLPAQRKALIVDACFHGEGKSVVGSTIADQMDALREQVDLLDSVDLDSGEAHLFASTFGHPAFEDRSLGHGLYTHALLQAMTWDRSAADTDGDGVLTAWEAHDHARRQVMDRSAGQQVPEASFRVVGRNDVVLAGDVASVRERALVFHYGSRTGRWAGATLRIDGQSKGVFPGTVAVPPGRHHVELLDSDGQLQVDGYTTLAAGQSLSVADLTVASRNDRALYGVRLGYGGSPGGSWDSVWGDGFGTLEFWAALRRAKAPARGLYTGVALGAGLSPTRVALDGERRKARALLSAGLEGGWGFDVRRLRMRGGWSIRATLLPVTRRPGPEHELLDDEAGWLLLSTGPVVHVGVHLNRRATLIFAGSAQGLPARLDGSPGSPRFEWFATASAGIEFGL